jgi:hypothetical protein
MRLSTSGLTTVARACSAAILCLLCAAVASASPAHRHARRTRAGVCDPHRTTLANLAARQTRGGPVAPPSTRALVGLDDPASHVQRARTPALDDDGAAIQNDAPADDLDAGLAAAPVLHPLGLLARRIDRLPKLDPFSRWSPRGPPLAA